MIVESNSPSREQFAALCEGVEMYVRFVAAWLVITVVASYDAYLTVKHRNVMAEVELNPVGRMVLDNEGGVPVLIGLKMAGIALALLLCFGLWQREAFRRKVLIASYTVAALALGMIVVMHDDSARDRQVQEDRRSVNRPSTQPMGLIARPIVFHEHQPPAAPSQGSDANLTDGSDLPRNRDSASAASTPSRESGPPAL
jgi:hypothetical protein